MLNNYDHMNGLGVLRRLCFYGLKSVSQLERKRMNEIKMKEFINSVSVFSGSISATSSKLHQEKSIRVVIKHNFHHFNILSTTQKSFIEFRDSPMRSQQVIKQSGASQQQDTFFCLSRLCFKFQLKYLKLRIIEEK